MGVGTVVAGVLGGLAAGVAGAALVGSIVAGAASGAPVNSGNTTVQRWSVCEDWARFVVERQAAGVPDNRIDAMGVLMSNKALSADADVVSVTPGVAPTTPPAHTSEQQTTQALPGACGTAAAFRQAATQDLTLDQLLPQNPAETYTAPPLPSPSSTK